MLSRIAPPFTNRRLALQLVRHAVRQPGSLHTRLNRHNLRLWNHYRRTVAGCPICGHEGRLVYEMPDLERHARHHIEPHRETLRCAGCKAKMRDRMVAAGLLDVLADRGILAPTISELAAVLPEGITILDTDAYSRISHRLTGHPAFYRSVYVPERANGERLDDERMLNVDLEQMPFPDGYFDVIITSEVMEHVRYADRAHAEIARCLKPDGAYVFTVPYDERLQTTWRLVDEETDRDLVHPPHIHGDPMLREGGIRSYRVFGRDIVDQLRRAGLAAEFHRVDRPELGIFGGDLFVAEPVPVIEPVEVPTSSTTPRAEVVR